MSYETLIVTESLPYLTVTIHRPTRRNSINEQLLADIHHVLDLAEHTPECRFIVLQGENGLFCTGMDFQELVQNRNEVVLSKAVFSSEYMRLLKRFTTSSKIVLSLLNGEVLAGGVGIVAASDLVISTPRTQFGLSEVLWGLLPACVTPFLIRRIGFQKAYSMTLTTQNIPASEAHRIGLIDELTDHLDESLRRLVLRLKRVPEETVKDLKAYFQKMWIITETMEVEAVSEINRLVNKPQVRANIKNFFEHQKFPWENSTKEKE